MLIRVHPRVGLQGARLFLVVLRFGVFAAIVDVVWLESAHVVAARLLGVNTTAGITLGEQPSLTETA
jgi:hypothetical protein